jgi:hypothetical protein
MTHNEKLLLALLASIAELLYQLALKTAPLDSPKLVTEIIGVTKEIQKVMREVTKS